MELYHVTDDSSTILTTLRIQRPVINRFARFLSTTGKTIVTCNTGIPLYDDQGSFIGAVSFEQDVHALEKRREQNEKIRLAMQQVITKGLYAKDPTSYTFEDFIGHTSKIKEVVDLAQTVSAKESNILILGETGTGKEIIAQSIHHDSLRSKHKFLAINCAAIPEQLAESILFGTEKGSFTGSVQKRGLFEEADQGTIFLDELNSMGLGLQSKLLRVLQEGVFRRVGGNRDLRSNVRIIASCNENIFQLVEENKLRRDLFYRIATVIIDLPPLRDHIDDLEVLTWHHIHHSNANGVPKFTSVHPEVFRIFRQYKWPGNVRELNHILDYAETVAAGDTLIRDYLPSYLLQAINSSQSVTFFASETDKSKDSCLSGQGNLTELLARYETVIIQQALIKHDGNITKAAKSLGIQRQNLQYRLKKLNIKS